MKKFYAFTMAVALLAPIAVFATPAGATVVTSCTIPAGKVTLSPGLSNVPTKNKIVFRLPLTNCKHSVFQTGIASGVVPPGAAMTCASLGSSGPITFKFTLNFSTGAVGTFAAKATTKASGGKISSTITGTGLKKPFKNEKLTATVSVGLDAKSGACSKKKPVKDLLIKGLKPLVIQ